MATLPQISTACYAIDSRASQFTVKAFASGLISVVAHSPTFAIREISGEAIFEPESMAHASMRMTADPLGMELKDETSGDERRAILKVMHQEVLESSRYPSIVFQSRRINAAKLGDHLYLSTIEADLSLHGITRQVTLTAQTVVGDDTMRAIGDFTIQQTDFAMNIVSIANSTLRLKDELKFNFFIVARRKW